MSVSRNVSFPVFNAQTISPLSAQNVKEDQQQSTVNVNSAQLAMPTAHAPTVDKDSTISWFQVLQDQVTVLSALPLTTVFSVMRKIHILALSVKTVSM